MPPDDPSDHALSIARLAGDGVGAAVLVGSQARGDAGPESDLDVLAVGPRTFTSRPERRDGLLLSVSSQPFEAYRREMADPGSVCTAVPDWREAVVLHNPEGKAGALLEEARAWTWGPRSDAATGGWRRRSQPSPKRCTSWSRRSGHRLWDLIAEGMGEEWHVAQSAALGLNGDPFEVTCRAALKFYGLAVDNVYQLLDERQRGVANHAHLLAATEG